MFENFPIFSCAVAQTNSPQAIHAATYNIYICTDVDYIYFFMLYVREREIESE